MKICFLTTSFPYYEGHSQSPFIFNLAKDISKKADIDVICPFYRFSRKSEEVIGSVKVHRFKYFFPLGLQKLTEAGGIPSSMKASFFAKIQLPFFLVSMFFKSIKYARKCDVIHANWALSGLVGVLLKKMFKKPLILTTRGAALNLAVKSDFMKKILLFVLKNCDYLTPNNYAHADLIQKLGISSKKITVIPNGVDTDMFKPLDKGESRKKLDLDGQKTILLFVGWLIERKGLKYLLEAIPKIIESHKDVLLVVLGEGIQETDMKNLTDKLGISSNVMFKGAQKPDVVPYWMDAADIFVLPSLSEGRPNVVPEALSSGLPVIATDIPGTREFIKDRENGLLVAPKSSDAIVNAVSLILKEPKLKETLTENSRKSILEMKLSWESSAEKYLEIFNQMHGKFTF